MLNAPWVYGALISDRPFRPQDRHHAGHLLKWEITGTVAGPHHTLALWPRNNVMARSRASVGAAITLWHEVDAA